MIVGFRRNVLSFLRKIQGVRLPAMPILIQFSTFFMKIINQFGLGSKPPGISEARDKDADGTTMIGK